MARTQRGVRTLLTLITTILLGLAGLTTLSACDSVSPLGPDDVSPPSGDVSVPGEDDSGLPGDDGASGDDVGDGGGAGGEGLHANEPSGFRTIAETSYSSNGEGGFSGASFRGGDFSIVSDPTAPFSGPSAARAYFPAGMGDGVSPISSEVGIGGEGVEELYVSYWLKISDNWDGHQTGVNKTTILWTHQKPVVVVKILGTGSNALTSEIGIQDVPDGNRKIFANVSDPEIERGRWHHWEVLLRSNQGNSADGEIHWWVDGEKVGEYDDVRFGSSGQSKTWDTAAWRPVWGGRGDVLSEPQEMWMDHYYVSGRSW